MRIILTICFFISLFSPSLASSETIKPLSTASLTNIKKERRCGAHVAQNKLLCLHRHGKLDAIIAPTNRKKREPVFHDATTTRLFHLSPPPPTKKLPR